MITPNPFTSGGARWNLMAAYGSQIAQGKSEDEALDFIAQMLENTPVQDASARDALQTFIGGKGDVLLSYENEAIGAIDAGEELEYIDPRRDDPDRDQGGRLRGGGRSRGRAGVPRLPAHRRGPAAVGRERLPPGERGDPRRVLGRVPGAEGAVHDRGVRRLGDGRRPSSSTRRAAPWPRSSATSGWLPSESRGVATARTPEAEPQRSASGARASPEAWSSATSA